MSVPDKDLDEPDGALCSEHCVPLPCRYCKFEAQMQRAEEIREEQMFNDDPMRESQP